MFVIYFVVVLAAGVRSVLSKKNGAINGSMSLFNFVRSLSAFVLFGVLALVAGFQIHYPTLVYGVIYGLLYFGSCFYGLRAMSRGPLGITCSFVAFSLVIPCICGVVFFNEKISTFDIIGFVLIIVSILMMNKKTSAVLTHSNQLDSAIVQKDTGGLKFKKGWGMFVFGAIVCDGLQSTLKKIHQTEYPGLYRYEFMCIGMFVGMLAFLLLAYKNQSIIRERGKNNAMKCTLYGVIAGISNGVYSYLILYLAGIEGATALFPIVAVTTIAIGPISGRIIFKERLNILQVCGVLVAALAIFFIKI